MLEIRLLGEQRVVVDGEVVTAAQSWRALGLLAQLVLHADEDVGRAWLAGLFWPDSSDEQALTNLRRELHQLRRSLPAAQPCLTTDHRTLRWHGGDHSRCDVVEFREAAAEAATALAAGAQAAFRAAAARAAARYTGDLLPAWYDDWVVAERDALRRRCVQLLDALVDDCRATGDVGAGTEYARRRTELEPLEEGGYRTLMEMQARSGDRASALRSYHRCASVLERELGVAPDPRTTELYARLAGPDVPRPGRSVPAPSVARGAWVRLVGRDDELAALAGRWNAARAGRPGLHLVTGEAGVGKSRLVEELAGRAERAGAVVARARCFAGRARLALAPVAEWLASAGLESQRDRLDRAWAVEVERLVPSPGSRPSPPSPMVDAWQRHRFFEGLARAALAPARPTLLVLDDVQWCDADTLTWLQLLFRLGPSAPLLVLAAARTEEMTDNPDLSQALRALHREGLTSVTELGPLAPDATVELAREASGEVGDLESLHAVTGGYPLFVIESSRASALPSIPADLVERLPLGHAVLAGRLAQLGAEATEVAALAAAVGRDFSLELLTEASDLPPDVVVSAVDELWRRRLVVQLSPTSYDFAHDLLREAAYETTTPPKRTLLHRRVAQATELLHADDVGAVAAILADQYEHAGLTQRAVRAHVLAAETACGRFANGDAIRHYQRAADLLDTLPPGPGRDREELAIRHAMSTPLNAHHGYASPRLQEAFERSHALAERLGESRLQLLSLVGLFSVRFVQGHTDESYAIAQRALALSAAHPDVVGQAHFSVGGAATSLGRLAEAIPHFELAQQLGIGHPPALVGTRPEVHSAAWAAHALWLAGRHDDAAASAAWATERAVEADHPYSLAVSLAYATLTAQFGEDRERTGDLAEQTLSVCRRYGFAYYAEWGAILRGWCRGGEAGVAEIRDGLRGLDQQGAYARRPYYLSLLGRALLDLERREEADAILGAAQASAESRHDVWWLPEVLRLRAGLASGRRRTQLLRQSLGLAEQHGSSTLAQRSLAALGHAAAAPARPT